MIILFQLEKLPYPEADFTGKTVIVFGSKTGMGKEVVRHFVRLNASKVSIGVRSLGKGKAVQEDNRGHHGTTRSHGRVGNRLGQLGFGEELCKECCRLATRGCRRLKCQ